LESGSTAQHLLVIPHCLSAKQACYAQSIVNPKNSAAAIAKQNPTTVAKACGSESNATTRYKIAQT
jgi:hypothetical protein